MQIKFFNNKWLVTELTNPEKMHLRRNSVNVQTQGSALIMEDNIYNRILLNINLDTIMRDNRSHAAMEANINPQAREYQSNDLIRMLQRTHILNRNKPGYGKTFESIEYCRLMGFNKILIICPKSVCTQWKSQFARWWPEVEQHVVVGGPGPKSGVTSIFVTNYEQFTPVNVSEDKRKKKLAYPQVWQRCKSWIWDCIILDESHRIKNPKAQITIALKQLPSVHRLCLTGTPILGRPNDLWSQLHFLDPRWSGNNYWLFTERFCEIEANNWGKKPVGLTPSDSAQGLLALALSEMSVGGDNQSVTQGKNFIEIDLDMPPKMRTLYSAIANLALDKLDELGITVKNAMDQIVKQQQCTTNIGKLTDTIPNPKFEWIKDWLEDNEGEKAVIFTKFAEAAKSLQEYLSKSKILCGIYIGEMSEKDRIAAKERFVQLPAQRVIIGTIGAMGTGVDGLQEVCRNVIFLDRDWTPGINEQAESRVDRSGQVGMTNIWILYMKSTIDRFVEGIQTKKAEDIKELFKHVSDCLRSGE